VLEQSAGARPRRRHDVRPAVELATRGGVLDPAALHAVATSIAAGSRARALDGGGRPPALWPLAEGIEPRLAAVAGAREALVEDDGSIPVTRPRLPCADSGASSARAGRGSAIGSARSRATRPCATICRTTS
jgi:hypothetical protein